MVDFISRMVVLATLLASLGCLECREDEVREGTRCIRTCNQDDDCAAGQVCQDGRCGDGEPVPATSSSSHGSGGSSGTGTSASASGATSHSASASTSQAETSSSHAGSSSTSAGAASSSSAAVSSSAGESSSSSAEPPSSSAEDSSSSSGAEPPSSSAEGSSSSSSAETSSSAVGPVRVQVVLPEPPELAEGLCVNVGMLLDHVPSAPVSVPVKLPGAAGAVQANPNTLSFFGTASASTLVCYWDDNVARGAWDTPLVFEALETADTEFSGLVPPAAVLHLLDNDTPALNVMAPTPVLFEGGSNGQLQVLLGPKPTQDVVVDVSSLDPTVLAVDAPELRWTPEAAAAALMVTLVAVDDAVARGTQTVTLRVDASRSPDPEYAAMPPVEVQVTLFDNDAPGVAATLDAPRVLEGGSTVLRLSLLSQPTAPVTLTLAADPATRASALPQAVSFTPEDWDVVQGITVDATDNLELDGDAVVQLSMTLASADEEYAALQPPGVPVLVQSDERLVYVTTTSYAGNLGGIAGADTKCSQDSARPPSTPGPIHALLADGSARVASRADNLGDGQVDWVLVPGARYLRPDGALVLRANSVGLLDFLGGQRLVNPLTATGTRTWTGLTPGWVTQDNKCNKWATNSPFSTTTTGDAAALDGAFLKSTSSNCNTARRLVCVQ